MQDRLVRKLGAVAEVVGAVLIVGGCLLLGWSIVHHFADAPWAAVPVVLGTATVWVGWATRRTFVDVSVSGLIIGNLATTKRVAWEDIDRIGWSLRSRTRVALLRTDGVWIPLRAIGPGREALA